MISYSLPSISEEAAARAEAHWNSIAKPIGSLGLLEEAVIRIAALTGDEKVCLDRRAVAVFCADNGIVAEGVTQTGQEVTALVAGNMVTGRTSVCQMARCFRTDVFPVDIGMVYDAEGVISKKIARGTADMSLGPAMTREQAESALSVGVEMVRSLKEKGYQILVTGEMGIGNTATSSAMASVFLGRPVAEMTGRGAGLSDDGLRRKTAAIERAIHVNRPDGNDALDVLAKLGGFDIAGMAGLFIGGALYRIPVVIDGFISAVAALTAEKLCPGTVHAMLASHTSAEPAARGVLEALSLRAPITAGLRLGEGTGGVCLLPLLDAALAVYHGMASFSDIGMNAYEVPEQADSTGRKENPA